MWGISITACCDIYGMCWWVTYQMIWEELWIGLHCDFHPVFTEIVLFTITSGCSTDLTGEYVWQFVDSLWLECEIVSMITRNSSWQVTLTVTWLLLQLVMWWQDTLSKDDWMQYAERYSDALLSVIVQWLHSVEVRLKSSDVYSWKRDEVSTSSDCDVILVA